MKNLDRYFEKCIRDAFRSEERCYCPEGVKWFYVVVENQILFDIVTPYDRVTGKAIYRINRNIKKNFGFRTQDGYFLDSILQPNFVCNYFKVGESDYFLCKRGIAEAFGRGEVILCKRYEKLVIAYHGITIDQLEADRENVDKYYLPKMTWKDYRELYAKAFGDYPEVY